MKLLQDAIRFERLEALEAAADAYEEHLKHNGPDPAVMVDLAVLYWDATDPGARWVSREFFERAGVRYEELLDSMAVSFPSHSSGRFWRSYIPYASLGEPLAASFCRDLLESNPADLTPVLYLGGILREPAYEEATSRLRAECRDRATARTRYMMSILGTD